MLNKLIIGSANFGMEYGIVNKRKLSREEVFEILEYAHKLGIWGIDTAKAYGDAEKVIGDFFSKHGKIFNVITKLPKKEYKTTKEVEDDIGDSLKNMSLRSIDFLLLHSFETYKLYGKTIIPVLKSLCKDNIIGHYGISVYHPEEVFDIMSEVRDSLTIEFPMNIFDQRFLKNNFLQKLKYNGNFLFVRSIFLQGLFFLKEEDIKDNFVKVKDKIKKIKKISEEYNIRSECIALLFVIMKPWIDGVVIGVDSKAHLLNNIQCLSPENVEIYRTIEYPFSDLEITDEDIILPYKWKE